MSKETPAHVNFDTLGAFAELRDSAPSLPKDIGSSVVFLVSENGTYKMLNGRICGIVREEYGMRYNVMTRSGYTINGVSHTHVIAV
jgi:hypothetical protein